MDKRTEYVPEQMGEYTVALTKCNESGDVILVRQKDGVNYDIATITNPQLFCRIFGLHPI